MKNPMAILKLIRPHQWVKNLFVFLPMFFDGELLNVAYLGAAVAAFFAFSFMASSIYCINDIKDVEGDRAHPRKCHRPVASGAVSERTAWVATLFLMALSVAISVICLGSGLGRVLMILGIYWLMNVAYCFRLKHVPIVDVFMVAIGFVLRLCLGGVVTDTELSPWIVCMTFLLTLFIAVAKRRDDVVIYEREGTVVRHTSTFYNLAFLNQTLGILASVTIVCYVLYTVSPETVARFNSRYVYVTAVFMLAGLLHYLRLVLVENRSGDPTAIVLHDRALMLCIALWLLSFLIIIYIA